MNKTFRGPSKEQAINFWKGYFEYHGDPVEEQKKEYESFGEYHRNKKICFHCGHQLRRK